MLGTRRNANPYWSEKRKAAVSVANWLGKSKELSVPAAEFEDLYCELGNNFHGGTLNWKSSRTVAWWPVKFASDELVNRMVRLHQAIAPHPGGITDPEIRANARCFALRGAKRKCGAENTRAGLDHACRGTASGISAFRPCRTGGCRTGTG